MSFCYKLILPSLLGFFMESFECALPNGFHYSGAEGSTFLDAVYVENLSTYFVLDALQVPRTSCVLSFLFLYFALTVTPYSPTLIFGLLF